MLSLWSFATTFLDCLVKFYHMGNFSYIAVGAISASSGITGLSKYLTKCTEGIRVFTLLMTPPLSATPSAPTITRSTFSIMKLYRGDNQHVMCVDSCVDVQVHACGALRNKWSYAEMSSAHPAAESRITFEGIFESSSNLCIVFLSKQVDKLWICNHTKITPFLYY